MTTEEGERSLSGIAQLPGNSTPLVPQEPIGIVDGKTPPNQPSSTPRTPTWPYLEEFRKLNKRFKKKQKQNFDKRHRSHELDDIPDETPVWITSEGRRIEGRVVSPAKSPRSYLVETPSGVVRRNRVRLNVKPEIVEEPEPVMNKPSTDQPQPNRIITRSQTGSSAKPPKRLYS